jgi:hypothetical protein
LRVWRGREKKQTKREKFLTEMEYPNGHNSSAVIQRFLKSANVPCSGRMDL